jgi:ATP synthase protein I
VQFWKSMIAPAQSDDDDDAGFKALTAEEAKQLRLRHPPVSPWWVVAGQLVVGCIAALAAWGLTGRSHVGWSVAYGALAVVIPAALFARGLMGRFASLNPASAAMAFFVWEMVKLGVSVFLLVMAPRMVPGLSWVALLIGLVLTMKIYWVALLIAPKNVKH